MSSTINRRFLDVSLSVLGIVNEPPATPAPKNGTQYIVGSEPAASWTGATANALARYDGYDSKWKFTKPAPGQMEVLNTAAKTIMSWDGEAWATVVDLNSDGGAASDSVEKFVKALVFSGNTLPSTAKEGAKFLNTADAKLYTAIAENTWDSGVALAPGDRYVSVDDNKIYVYADNALTGAKPADGVIFLSLGDNVVFGYDAARDKLVVVPGGDVETPDTPGPIPIPTPKAEFTFTEVHKLTAEDVTAKGFNLTYDVATDENGDERPIMLSVCGMVQVPGDDFEVAGKLVSWANKGLDSDVGGIGMEVNDVFIVSYPTLG